MTDQHHLNTNEWKERDISVEQVDLSSESERERSDGIEFVKGVMYVTPAPHGS
jgi:hypothetical protein